MVPPTQTLNLDITAISGILGSISIACWIVVFSPQIIENFKRSSADGLSLEFIIIWLAGDIFNILGAVLQGVLPTMTILAVYYTLADLVLLAQCLYYRSFGQKKAPYSTNTSIGEPTERTGLLPPGATDFERRPSTWSDVSAHHLSPAVPLHEQRKVDDLPAFANLKPASPLQAVLKNTFAMLLVFAAGILGWYVSNRSQGGLHHKPGKTHKEDDITFNVLGQVFGYLCAVLYLASRVPQIALNYRRKSTEGVSFLFFLLACFGNLTYVLSIFAFEPRCHGKHGRCRPGESPSIYGKYILVNASWIAGSLGTLFLDLVIFVQFFMYRETDEDYEEAVQDDSDDRPLLSRNDSEF